MSSIIYREIKRSDYDQIREIINQSFGLYKCVDNGKILDSMLHAYLQSCLAEQTFHCVAEKDGKVIGVIMGQAKNKYHALAHLTPAISLIWYSLKMNAQAALHHCDIDVYKRLHQIYHEFLIGREKEFDGVLTLFAVSEECRGLGVGKTLLHKLLDYLKENGVKHIYLYTDSFCNVGFYESQGFERLSEKGMMITREHRETTMDVYMYRYTVQ
ncbi:MAG: GNAT family N-acetyltransferase [Clostridiaceae bacterium]